MAKIALVAKIRNGALYQLLQDKGWRQADLARAVGCNQTAVSLWMAMREYPKSPALRARIEEATGCLFEDLFPPEIQRLKRDPLPRELVAVREISLAALQARLRTHALPGPEEQAMATEAREMLTETIATCTTPRECEILVARFGLDGRGVRNLEEIGLRLNITRERVRQLEASAIRKLAHPKNREHFPYYKEE